MLSCSVQHWVYNSFFLTRSECIPGEFPEGAPSGPVELPAAEMGNLPALAKVSIATAVAFV